MTTETVAPVSPRRHAAPKRSAWKPLAAAGIGGAVLVATGFGVFAQLQATATNVTPQSVSSGDLKLVLAKDANAAGGVSAGFDAAISKLAPADTVTRLVSLTNSGNLDGTALKLAVTDASSPKTLLSTDATRGLQITIASCSVPWTVTSPTAAPSCTGTQTTALPTTPVASLGTAAPVTAATTAGSVNRFLVTVSLPEQTETSTNGAVAVPSAGTGSIQNLTASLTFTFTELQRAATNTNS